MCEVEIGEAALDDEADELLIGQVLLNHHQSHHLRDEVFQVVPVFSSVDDRVDALGGQQRVDLRVVGLVLVEFVQDLVNGLTVVVFNVFEALCVEGGTMLEDFSRLSIGIFSKMCYFGTL